MITLLLHLLLLLLLLLFLGLATAAHTPIASALQQACRSHAYSRPALQASHCNALPCNTTRYNLTLALPVLLTLKGPSSAKPPRGMSLKLEDDAVAWAWADLKWEEKHGSVILTARTCNGTFKNATFLQETHRKDARLHLGVAAEGGKVSFTHLTRTINATLITLSFQNHLPSKVTVTHEGWLGYSAPTVFTTTSTTATTQAYTSSFTISVCAASSAACTILLVAGLLLFIKCCCLPSLPTTTTTTTTTGHVLQTWDDLDRTWPPSQTPSSRHDSENSLYGVVDLLQVTSPHPPASLPRPDTQSLCEVLAP